MFHGHAVNIDMAFSATMAAHRGYITPGDRDRILGLMSRVGLALDSPYLTPELLRRGTEAIIQTRGGLLRAAVPQPIGTCLFVNDLTAGELDEILAVHREVCAGYPRNGDGEDMWTDFAATAELIDQT
jgi:3-dehydroquinate synthetase